jgi:uncharacterized membrane protein
VTIREPEPGGRPPTAPPHDVAPHDAEIPGAIHSRIRLPGIILGVGLGGFLDGIVLHQILQWHHMLTSTDSDRLGIDPYPSSTVHGLEVNTLWDGLFHVFTWLAVLTGLGILYGRLAESRAGIWSNRILWGWVLAGWGLFNIVEGLVDHQILGIHHVRSGAHQTLWDIGFLALGALLVAVGYEVQRSAVGDDATDVGARR